MGQVGGTLKKEGIYIYIYTHIHRHRHIADSLIVEHKLTQHCKAIIVQLKTVMN